MFDDADINDDGTLNYNEAQWFLREVRKLDRVITPENEQDEQLERINNHWFLASLSSSPNDSMSFSDYLLVENMMTAVYEANKLETTGFIDYWDRTSFKAYEGYRDESFIRNTCSTINLDGEDRITHIAI